MFRFQIKLGIFLFSSIFLLSSFLNAAETPFQTGILKVALNGDMPMTGLDDNGNLRIYNGIQEKLLTRF